MKIDVKPLTHWAIYKGYRLRFQSRTPERVTGIVTNSTGVVRNFIYLPEDRMVQLPDEHIQINDYGWEIERWAVP